LGRGQRHHIRCRLGLSVIAALALPVWPASAASNVFETRFDEAAFCAGAALSALPPPSANSAGPAPFLLAYVHHWMDRAVAEGAKRGMSADRSVQAVNAQTAAISAAFKGRSAPFYDLAVCDEAQPSVLWAVVPATIDTDRPYSPRSGPISLERLADDREADIYRSQTGRLRAMFADLSAADAFGLDVRILALRDAVADPNASDVGDLWMDLGEAFRERRIGAGALNQEQQVAAFKAAAATLEPSSTHWGLAQSDLCFAYFTRQAGERADNLERAVAACQTALPSLEQTGAREAWANTQLVLGGVWHDRMRGERADNIEQAIAADRAALATMSRDKDATRWAAAQVNLASHLSDRRMGARQSNVEDSIAAYEAAGTVMTRDKSELAWLVLQNDLAPLYAERRLGDPSANQERAIAMLDEVLSARDGSVGLRSSANYQLGQVHRRRLAGERRANLEMAVRCYRQALLGDPVNERWPIVVGAALGSVLIELGRYDEADDALRIASRAAERLIGLGLNDAQARDVLTDARDVYTLRAYAVARSGDPGLALSLLSAGKARLLFTALSADNLTLTPDEMAELRRLRGEIRQREADLEAGARGDPAALPPQGRPLDALEDLRQQAMALYAKGTSAAMAQPSAGEVVRSGAVIAPVVTDTGTEILVATSGGRVVAYDAPEVTRVSLSVTFNGPDERPGDRGWRGALVSDGDIAAGLEQVQPSLGSGLGGALRRALVAAGVEVGQSVVIMPDGASAILPVGLARDPSTGRTLIEDYEISFTPSLAALAASQRRAAQARDPSLGLLRPPSVAALEFAPLEGAMVSARFAPSRRHAWDGADKEALLGALRTLSYWHFATHGGFYWPDPRQSGILIGEDRSVLRLSDLLDARQHGGSPRLVVLSACDTGLSDVEQNPDEFTGLPTGFIFAGAAGVVASLWPVSDLSTTLLMGKFYDLHVGEGQPPAQALRKAELWLKDASLDELQAYVDSKRAAGALTEAQAGSLKIGLANAVRAPGGHRPFAQPRYWGAFVMYGS
jgi:tetratricopeptide (TPR) repeat protein